MRLTDSLINYPTCKSGSFEVIPIPAILADHYDLRGFSYGTVLGATYAALYPDKVERLILDGEGNFRSQR